MVPFQTIPPSESFGWKDFFDSLIKLSFFNSDPNFPGSEFFCSLRVSNSPPFVRRPAGVSTQEGRAVHRIQGEATGEGSSGGLREKGGAAWSLVLLGWRPSR